MAGKRTSNGIMTGGTVQFARRNETIHAPLFWRERSLLSVTAGCRGKRSDDRPYADLRRIARAKTYERLTIIPKKKKEVAG